MYCNQNYSSFRFICKGVPQGSILAPILFFVYINDIVNTSTKFEFIMYADDTTLLIRDKDINSLHVNLTSDLNKIKLWIQSNKLKLNVSKTNYILFQNRYIKKVIPPLLLDGEVLTQVNVTKFLCVKIDNLDWKYHIDDVCLKLSKITGIL